MGELCCIYCHRQMYVIARVDDSVEAWLCVCRNLIQRTRRKQKDASTKVDLNG